MRLMNSFLRFSVVTAALAASAESAYAGKFSFPYHHPDLEWYTIETEHFMVHYPISKRTREQGNDHYIDAEFMAKRSAKVAEEMWEPMCSEFNYYLTEKVHIVLLDQSDDLEGFTIPAWNWIEISGNPGGYFYRMRGRMEWFSDVLVHEFAHVVSLKRNAPISEGVGAISIGAMYGDGIRDMDSAAEITIQDTDPFWWTEGGAEYWSDNTGYNWWTSARDANLRTTVLEDRLLTFDEWITRIEKRDWGDGERGYQQGYSFALYLRERFGDKTYAEFSKASSKRWRANWETIVEAVTGVPAKTLYDDWAAYLKVKYTAKYEEIKAQGEVTGGELEFNTGKWVAKTPEERDEWLEQKATKRKSRKKADAEDAKERTGTWDFYPKSSDDGKWIGEHSAYGFRFTQVPEEILPPIAGADPGAGTEDVLRKAYETAYLMPTRGSNFGHSYDFVPGADKVVVSGNEDMHKGALPSLHFETDGYDWGQLYVLDLKPVEKKRKHADGKELYQTLEAKTVGGYPMDEWRYTAIPNTQRSADPAVSPDGGTVAYMEYADGTLNLVTISLDGSNKRYLTNFNDGTWLQNVDWSPDGTQLVFSMIRNFRQDLYIINADGTGLTALNRDEWEDQDPHWGKDGNIYFSSEPTGIFNIFRYEPATGKVTQLTNTIGGAECPWITPQGNLFYTNFTAHGWKNYALPKSDFLEKDVTGLFAFNPTAEGAPRKFDPAEVAADLAYVEDLSSFEANKEKYPALGKWMSPTAVPIIRFDNDSMSNFGLSMGVQVYAQDFVEDHTLFGIAMLGEDPYVAFGYENHSWHPTFRVSGQHMEVKTDYAFLLDDDDDLATTDDQSVFEGKQNTSINVLAGGIDYPINHSMQLGAYGFGYQYAFRGSSDKKFEPYVQGVLGGLNWSFSNVGGQAYSANPRGGRVLSLDYSHGFTDVVYKAYNGRDTDDGQVLDKYQYNKVEGRWTEHIPVPSFGIDSLRKARHTLLVDVQGGFVDRNVHFYDEFRGGGQHPFYVGADAILPNGSFAGYPRASLVGETMLMASLAYRFPIARQINKKIGPLYIYDVYAQFGGTTGNFWSFRAPEEGGNSPYYYDGSGQRVAYDPKDVRREIPFLDKAYKNGNYLVTDANLEVRVSATLFNAIWNSFVRLAWGFNEIGGVGDVNGDDIQDTTETGFGNSLSSETEKPGPRLYIGFGTGW